VRGNLCIAPFGTVASPVERSCRLDRPPPRVGCASASRWPGARASRSSCRGHGVE